MLRLNRHLASLGLGSRRKVEELILAGRISIDDIVCKDLATVVDPHKSRICMDGKLLEPQKDLHYIMLNKPKGYIVSRSDEMHRKTIYDLLPDLFQDCSYAGRLDKDSEGLLLITNDGDLIQALTHPSRKVEKVYRAEIDRRLSHSQIEELRRGIMLEGKKTLPAGVYVKTSSDSGCVLKMVITEGRKRQIRLMLEAVGARVSSLKRLQFGILKLDDLPLGNWRSLTVSEVRSLKISVAGKSTTTEKKDNNKDIK